VAAGGRRTCGQGAGGGGAAAADRELERGTAGAAAGGGAAARGAGAAFQPLLKALVDFQGHPIDTFLKPLLSFKETIDTTHLYKFLEIKYVVLKAEIVKSKPKPTKRR
jgi:hypothetical protein